MVIVAVIVLVVLEELEVRVIVVAVVIVVGDTQPNSRSAYVLIKCMYPSILNTRTYWHVFTTRAGMKIL